MALPSTWECMNSNSYCYPKHLYGPSESPSFGLALLVPVHSHLTSPPLSSHKPHHQVPVGAGTMCQIITFLYSFSYFSKLFHLRWIIWPSQQFCKVGNTGIIKQSLLYLSFKSIIVQSQLKILFTSLHPICGPIFPFCCSTQKMFQ